MKGVETKKCGVCGEVKSVDNFHKKRYFSKSGSIREIPAARCKPCHVVVSIASRRKNAEHYRAYERSRKKGETYRSHRKKYRKRPEVRAREQAYEDRQRKLNPGRFLEKLVRNAKRIRLSRRTSEAKRRAAGYTKNRATTQSMLGEALALARVGDKYLDAYTGELIDDPTVDHITPLVLGGTSEIENLCVTSRSNNSSKNKSLLIVWLARRLA